MRVMILTNSPKYPETNSGYATVARNLSSELSGLGHDIAITGMQTSYSMGNLGKIPIYPIMNDFHEAGSIQEQIRRLILNMKDHQSEALLCLFQGDSMYNPFTQVHPNTVWYVPIEGQIVYRNHPLFTTARTVKKVVAMTHSAGEQLSKRGIENTVIYHGYNPKVFRKDCQKSLDEPVNIYFPEGNHEITIPASALAELRSRLGVNFIIGYGGQNFGVRKRPERLIEAFSIFARDKKDVHLHMHCFPASARGLNLIEAAEYYGVKDKITFSYGSFRSSGWSPQALNILYNIFDIFATASSGEGFGLMHLESMACGIPQVAPDTQPFREFFGYDEEKRGLLAKATGQWTPAGEIRALVDVKNLAEKMESLYAYDDLRKHLSQNCSEWARAYTWDKIAVQFDQVFRELQ